MHIFYNSTVERSVNRAKLAMNGPHRLLGGKYKNFFEDVKCISLIREFNRTLNISLLKQTKDYKLNKKLGLASQKMHSISNSVKWNHAINIYLNTIYPQIESSNLGFYRAAYVDVLLSLIIKRGKTIDFLRVQRPSPICIKINLDECGITKKKRKECGQ